MKKQKLVTMSAPSVVINGEEEVILEGKFRLCDYSSARVVLDLKYRGKCAVISGEALRLCAAAENVVSVAGKIHSFSYEYLSEVRCEQAD